MDQRPALRASDSDRELVGERLRQAAVEGRLLADELEERLAALFASRTYAELDRLVADLPAPVARIEPRPKALSAAITTITAISLLVVLAAFAVATRGHEAAARLPNGRVINVEHHQALPLILGAPVLAAVLTILALCAAAGWAWRHGGPPGDPGLRA